jgi:chromosome segregation ATPase
MIRRLVLPLFLFSIGSLMAQNTPVKFKEWSVEQKAVSGFSDNACIATTIKKEKEVTWQLSLIVDATKDLAPFAILSTDSPLNLEQITTLTDGSATQKFIFLKNSKTDSIHNLKSYWFAPTKFAQFNRQLRRDNTLKIAYKDEAGKDQRVYLSLSGSTAALSDVSKKCALNKELFYPEFFDYVDNLPELNDPNFKDKGTDLSWEHLDASWAQYLEGSRLSSELKANQAKMDPLLEAQRRYLEKSGNLNRDIQSRTQRKSDLEAQNQTLIADRSNKQNQLADRGRELEAANAQLQIKEAAYKPLREEIKSYLSAVSGARSEVNRINNLIESHNSTISDSQRQIESLNSRLRRISSDIDDEEAKLSRLRSDRVQAQSDLNSFNYDYEVRRRLNSDSQYQTALRNTKNAEDAARNEEHEHREHEADVRRLQSDLRNCEARKKPDGTPEDCSHIRQELSQAQRLEDESERKIRDYQATANYNRAIAQQREQEIENTVAAQRNELANRVTRIDREISTSESEISSLEREETRIRQSELPTQERRLSDARNGLSQASADLQRAQREQANAERELAAYKSRTDYTRIENEYVSAVDTVNALRYAMAKLDAEIQKLSTQISKNSSSITKLQSEIETLMADAAKNVKELEGVEAQLNPLKAEKERLGGLLAESQRVMQEQVKLYKATLKNTLLPVQLMDKTFWNWM